MSKPKNKLDKPNKIKIPRKDFVELDYPIFCFKHLQTEPNPKNRSGFYAEFISRLKKLSNLGWSEINRSHRHSFGTEKIPVEQIKLQKPQFITPDITNLIVFRAAGDKRPFLGIQKGNTFHVIFIEESFGDVYDHE
ncbi:MAG: hypothetical protein LBB56_07745 [Chitinispirillales bacterium]|jgi:hypothetical protein|nr:hypothetical protein [Chitinispirillales bacterium]